MEVSRNLGAHNDDFYFLHAGTELECGTKAAGYLSGISCAVQLPQTDIFDFDCDGDYTDFVLVGTGPDCGSGSRLCRVVEDTLNKMKPAYFSLIFLLRRVGTVQFLQTRTGR